MKYLLFLFFLFSGCMVGPQYHEPEMCLPPEFEENIEGSESLCDYCKWWKQFNDPVLDDLIEEALCANYDLRIAIEKIEQARAQYRIERSHLWPEIDFNATASRSRISQNFLPTRPAPGSGFPPKYLNIFQVGFDAIWEFDLWGKFRHAKNAAYNTVEAMQADSESVLISLVSEVAVNYVNLRAIQKKIELTEMRIHASEQELAIANHRFQIGLNNEIQVNTLISALESDRSSLPVLITSFKQTVYALAYLLGREPECFIEIFEEIRPIPPALCKVPVGLPSDLLRRRPDIRSAERQLAAATEQIGVAVADLFPHVGLTGISLGAANQTGSSIGYESFKLDKLFTPPSGMFSVGLGLNWDLIDFGRVRGKIAVQNSLQQQALLNYEKTVIAALKDVESALVAYFEENLRLNSLLKKTEADRSTFKITENLFKIGLADETKVQEALKTLLLSENSLVESEQALAGDLIALYKALGGDWDCCYTERDSTYTRVK